MGISEGDSSGPGFVVIAFCFHGYGGLRVSDRLNAVLG